MLNLINSRILISGAAVLLAAAVAIGATFAFFSDTETSTNNVFEAGDIDLKIDNESYAIDYLVDSVGNPTGALVLNENTSWDANGNPVDLTVQKFFDFEDLKPGDFGEDTISIHVGSNDAWLCAAAQITEDDDVDCTDPESESTDPECSAPTPTPGAGELDSQINFVFWKDDGDNVFETGDSPIPGGTTDGSIFLQGPISGIGLQGKIALADSSGTGPFGNTPIPGTSDPNGIGGYIGKAWCFGTLNAVGITQDGLGKTGNNGPTSGRGTGFTCDGSTLGNEAQTDKVVGDLQFFAIQARNNGNFLCSTGYTPVFPTS